MNLFWSILILVSVVFGIINGNVDEVITAGMNGSSEAVKIVLSFAGIMCLWNGLLEAAVKSGVSDFIKKLMMPVMKKVFPNVDEDSEAMKYMTLNITANMLGTGNGATPVGVRAMKELNRECCGRPDVNMATFAVMNTAAFQLVPSSIIALRSAYGSSDAFSVIVPIWICSAVSLCAAVCAVKLLYFISGKREEKNG